MSSMMRDVTAAADTWTEVLRGTANPVVMQNLTPGVVVLYFVGATQPLPAKNSDARWLKPESEVELSLLVDDRIWLKPAGDRSATVNVWYG